MYEDGRRRRCPECGQSVTHIDDRLSHRPLYGPRQITSSNIDRILDDDGHRLLLIEEKNPGEPIKDGQRRLLRALSAIPEITVWGVKGTPQALSIWRFPEMEKVASGDWAIYQQAVSDWFASPRPPRRDWLRILAEAPYANPDWCEPELWHQFDAILAQVAARMP